MVESRVKAASATACLEDGIVLDGGGLAALQGSYPAFLLFAEPETASHGILVFAGAGNGS